MLFDVSHAWLGLSTDCSYHTEGRCQQYWKFKSMLNKRVRRSFFSRSFSVWRFYYRSCWNVVFETATLEISKDRLGVAV